MTENRATYEGDEFNWAIQLAERLRLGEWDEADRAGLVDHLEWFVVACRCDVSDASLYLLQTLLLITTQAGAPPPASRLAVVIQQRKLQDVLRRWPGLLPTAPDLFAGTYDAARKCTAQSTGRPENTFPAQCPWTLEEALAVKWPRSP